MKQSRRARAVQPSAPAAPPPALNAEERLDRRQNAVNTATRNLSVAKKKHADALDRFNDTSPCADDAEQIAGDLRAAAKELAGAWKSMRDTCASLS